MHSSESTSSMESFASIPPSFSDQCPVCGDSKVSSGSYGPPACHGCDVFFRRAGTNALELKCSSDENCQINYAFQHAAGSGNLGDVPPNLEDVSPVAQSSPSPNRDLLEVLVNFQKLQMSQWLSYFTIRSSRNENCRAEAEDVRITLKLNFSQATDWARRFEQFRRLPEQSKTCVLAEYAFAFYLIDQAFKTACEADEGFWLLQNDSFMHPDYFYGLETMKNAQIEAKEHEKFVNELINSVSGPFRRLNIDEKECAALKVVLLFAPSFARQSIYSGQEKSVGKILEKCMQELMEHSSSKFPTHGAERFGEILLLTSSIRCAIKLIYNQTRTPGIFSTCASFLGDTLFS